MSTVGRSEAGRPEPRKGAPRTALRADFTGEGRAFSTEGRPQGPARRRVGAGVWDCQVPGALVVVFCRSFWGDALEE